MKKHTVPPVPAVPGIDLSYRPRTYFGPLPLETRLLSRVTGHQRREILRTHLEAGDGDYPPELEQSTLDERSRAALGGIHPAFMGGEYLPPIGKNETEIARISLASTTADQISIRARRLKDRIAYRIVDEYPEVGPYYSSQPRTTRQPLTLGELLEMIDGACEDGGAAFGPIIGNARCGGGDPLEDEDFVSVHSEFYPPLRQYYEFRFAVYFAALREPEDDDLICKTGLPVSAASSESSTRPSPGGTAVGLDQDKKPVKPISPRGKTPEEYRTQGGWQIGTVHRAASSQTAQDTSETKRSLSQRQEGLLPKPKKSPPAK